MSNLALVITREFSPFKGGVQRSTDKLSRLFHGRGYKTVVICFYKGHDTIVDGINIFYVGNNVCSSKKLHQIFVDNNIQICINQMGADIRLTKVLRNTGGESLVLLNTVRINPLNFIQNASIFLEEFLNKRGFSFININLIKFPVLVYHRSKQHRDYTKLLKITDGLVFLSHSFISELKQFRIDVNRYQDKLFSIANPFQFNNVEKKLDKRNVILYVGRLVKVQKRVDLLMIIWSKLNKRLIDWEFWVVGDGPELNNMKNIAFKNNLDGIKFFGFDDPEKYYKYAKILHFTSAFEGFGNVLVEAQRSGVVPVLFNSYSAASDIVEHNRNGILIEPFNIDDFVDQTINLTSNNTKLEKIANNALVDSKKFRDDFIVEKWINLFKKFQ